MNEILPFEMEGLFLSPSSALVFDFYPIRLLKKARNVCFCVEKGDSRKIYSPFSKGWTEYSLALSGMG